MRHDLLLLIEAGEVKNRPSGYKRGITTTITHLAFGTLLAFCNPTDKNRRSRSSNVPQSAFSEVQLAAYVPQNLDGNSSKKNEVVSHIKLLNWWSSSNRERAKLCEALRHEKSPNCQRQPKTIHRWKKTFPIKSLEDSSCDQDAFGRDGAIKKRKNPLEIN